MEMNVTMEMSLPTMMCAQAVRASEHPRVPISQPRRLVMCVSNESIYWMIHVWTDGHLMARNNYVSPVLNVPFVTMVIVPSKRQMACLVTTEMDRHSATPVITVRVAVRNARSTVSMKLA